MANSKTKVRKTPMKSRKLRFPEDEMNSIQLRADIYAGGNFSKWVRYCAQNCPPKVLVESDAD